MDYDPRLHRRRSIRLKHHDYTAPGAYFITICTHQRQCLFGDIINGEMRLNEFGQIAADCWQEIPHHFHPVRLDNFVIMPNHVHGILVITDTPRRGMALPCPYPRQFGKPIAQSISTIVGSFKSAVTKRINMLRDTPGTPVWQRNYYDRIIRDDLSMQHIRRYIQNNPHAWRIDQLHPANRSPL
ncbi:MAG: transposase [Synechococcales bacterium]|nr:transposase [Synechococcales bacterium]